VYWCALLILPTRCPCHCNLPTTVCLSCCSVEVDPQVVMPPAGDNYFTVQPSSPALALGFQPIDLRAVGPLPL
jgi:hypothetical protein